MRCNAVKSRCNESVAADDLAAIVKRDTPDSRHYCQKLAGARPLPLRPLHVQAEPPHLPVLTLKLPQDIGLRQSEIRSREPSK